MTVLEEVNTLIRESDRARELSAGVRFEVALLRKMGNDLLRMADIRERKALGEEPQS